MRPPSPRANRLRKKSPTPDAPLALCGDDAERMAAQEAWTLLEERGDALRFDAASMETIGKYEARSRRPGAYRPRGIANENQLQKIETR